VQGILLIDKPISWTSFDVVNYVRRIAATELGVKPKNLKVGHIGTLDPLATGLLVLLIGKEYTTRAQEMSKMDKVYKVEIVLGEITDSFDSETVPKKFSDKIPTLEEVQSVVNTFVGIIDQLPPAYSAIKVDGKRAYKLVRAGVVPDMKPRSVTIHQIDSLKYEYPKLEFSTNVSSGTYIRSLVNDIGKKLGTGGYMSGLQRVSIGKFLLSESISISNLNAELIKEHILLN